MKNIQFDKTIILFLYNKHKDYIAPIVTIIVSFLLFILFTLPQIESLSTIQQDVKFEKDKLTALKKSSSLLSGLNDSVLNSQLSIATDALPSNNNFSGVLNEISISSGKTGVFLGDFDFQVGDISSTVPEKGFSNLELSLTANGNASSIARFIDELYKSLPLVEITKIQVGSNRAQLNTLFYYKPYAQRNFDPSVGLTALTKTDLDTLEKISSWNKSTAFEELQPLLNTSKATNSATHSAF